MPVDLSVLVDLASSNMVSRGLIRSCNFWNTSAGSCVEVVGRVWMTTDGPLSVGSLPLPFAARVGGIFWKRKNKVMVEGLYMKVEKDERCDIEDSSYCNVRRAN